MRKIILHVGLHKTGSSSIQFNLKRYSDKLLSNNIYYFKFDENEWENHSVPLALIFQDSPRQKNNTVLNCFASDADVNVAKLLMYDYLVNELNSNNSNTLLISAEDLSDFSREDLINVKNFFLSFDDFEFEIVIYVRAPIPFALSNSQELIRAGLDSINSAFEKGNLQNAKSKITNFVNVFGINKTHVFSFDDAVLKHADVTKHFFEFLGCSDIAVEKISANTSSSLEKILVLAACHSFGSEIVRKLHIDLPDYGSKFSSEENLNAYLQYASESDRRYLEFNFSISFLAINQMTDHNIDYQRLHSNISAACKILLSHNFKIDEFSIYMNIVRDTIVYFPKLSSLISVQFFNLYKIQPAMNFIYYFKAIGITEGQEVNDIFILNKDLNQLRYFDSLKYLSAYPDVALANVDPFCHYYSYGKIEGREGFFYDIEQ